MPRILVKSLIATLLWRKLIENKNLSATIDEIIEFSKNVCSYIETNYSNSNFTYNLSENILYKLPKKEKWLKINNEKVLINKDFDSWENELIFNKDYYKNQYPYLNDAYNNSTLPYISKENNKDRIIYEGIEYLNKLEILKEKEKEIDLRIEKLLLNPILQEYIELKEKLKNIGKEKRNIGIDLLKNCPHFIVYRDKNLIEETARCLCCGKTIDIMENNIPYISGIVSFEYIKEIYDEIVELTKDIDEIKTIIISELK